MNSLESSSLTWSRFRTRGLTAAIFAVIAMTAIGCGDSYDPSAKPANANTEGRQLVLRLFNDVKTGNEADLREFLAPNFLLQRTTGPGIDRETYINGLPTLNGFVVGPVTAFQSADTITAAYTASTDLVVKGVKYPGTPAPFISSFVKLGGSWRMVAHGNFNQPK